MDDSIAWQMNDNDENLNTFQESIMMWGINVYNFRCPSLCSSILFAPSFYAILSTHCPDNKTGIIFMEKAAAFKVSF